MQLVVVMAVRKAVSAATTIFTATSISRAFFIINFVDFCHDSANHASMLALAAPKVQNS